MSTPPRKHAAKTAPRSRGSKSPALLSGGNPQIAKADGDAPVQAYIAATQGWKHDVVAQLDALITRAVPDVRKAVRWNSPFYGREGEGWFASYHGFAKYVKVSFFKGASLSPPPPVESSDPNVRYVHVYEADRIDEALWERWVTQAVALKGAPLF